MQHIRRKMNFKFAKTFALIVIAILAFSTATTALTTTVKAQTEPTGVSVGPPTLPYTGGPVPSGVTPQQTVQTIAYMSFVPNPIGVGQLLTVNVWVNPALNVARSFIGYTVQITQPDGSNITVPMDSYSGDTTAYFTWTPTTAGNYTLQFFFAGDYFPAGTYLDGIVNNTGAAVSGAAPTHLLKAFTMSLQTLYHTLLLYSNLT